MIEKKEIPVRISYMSFFLDDFCYIWHCIHQVLMEKTQNYTEMWFWSIGIKNVSNIHLASKGKVTNTVHVKVFAFLDPLWSVYFIGNVTTVNSLYAEKHETWNCTYFLRLTLLYRIYFICGCLIKWECFQNIFVHFFHTIVLLFRPNWDQTVCVWPMNDYKLDWRASTFPPFDACNKKNS